jgi:NADPH-dependent 2,4-dienoyl-CoA reductase/sulfur reductase-like enzyme/nitrite reductase/ring-hydroxylating ferredoxin subunit
MSEDKPELSGPDFTEGVDVATIPDSDMLLGHARGEPVLLVRRGEEFFAIGATCTHYGAPLVDGLLVDNTIRCPWHHASFCLDTGEVERAPALCSIPVWRVEHVRDSARQFTPVEQKTGVVYVREKLEPAHHGDMMNADAADSADAPQSIVIVGSGGAGNAAALMLREEGYAGTITMLSADTSPPYDRPNLSKGTLADAGDAVVTPPPTLAFYQEHGIDLRLNARVTRIDAAHKRIELEDGSACTYAALLLATGSEPVHLDLPGADLPHVHYLRTLDDCEALIASADKAKRVVVVGASFIGLEVAASLRARELSVDVIGREAIPMEKILGAEVGGFIRRLHEQHGVSFHLSTSPTAIDSTGVTLDNGKRLDADLVVIGVGVKPNIDLAQQAGLATDHGVSVDKYLQTSVPGIYAAGDIARWPDRLTGESIRVEHWVVAQRQGQTAARNMLGMRESFDAAVPFFWTEQYDFGLAYVGHAAPFDDVQIDGDLEKRDCKIRYSRDGKQLAVAVIHRDLAGLHAEVAFERTIANTVE